MLEHRLRVLSIVDGTTVDGPGFRTSIYFAGCTHRCPGCHNRESWDIESGRLMSVADLANIVEENDMDVTFSGGDPLMQAEALSELAARIKKAGRNVWCYTGFSYEYAESVPMFRKLLDNVDVLVDGPFIEELRDTSLPFRGSSNQRLIKVQPSRESGKAELWVPEF